MTKQASIDSKQDIEKTLATEKQWDAIIQKAAERYNVKVEDIKAIIGVESRARPGVRAGGDKSASGLMQVTAETWAQMQKTHGELAAYDFASNWMKPEINIMFGAATLDSKRKALQKMGVNVNGPMFAKLMVAAYNGGEGVLKHAVDHARKSGAKNPEEECLKFEHISYGVGQTSIWQYYMPGHKGASRNTSGTKDEAIRLKTNEILAYPNRIGKYLEAEGVTQSTTSETTSKTETKPTTTKTTQTTTTDTKTVPTAGHLISASVGKGGQNHADDVGAVQTALAAHGHAPEGGADKKMGPHTETAIRAFQTGFLKKPDGLVEVGKSTEKHLQDAATSSTKTQTEKKEPTKKTETSGSGSTQMSKLVSVASRVRSLKPKGKCYHAVKQHILDAGGYGNLHNVWTDKRMQPQTYAHEFADIVNRDPGKFGLEKLGGSSPYDAPEGSIVVVKAGSPGTHDKTAGDITVKGPGDEFYNDGHMGYRGRASWPSKTGGVLGIYKPK